VHWRGGELVDCRVLTLRVILELIQSTANNPQQVANSILYQLSHLPWAAENDKCLFYGV